MRCLSFISLAAAAATVVSGTVLPRGKPAPALPVAAFNTSSLVKPLSLDEAKNKHLVDSEAGFTTAATGGGFTTQATCSNPRVRQEWDSYSTTNKLKFINAINCLIKKPASGKFRAAKNRYEDLVAVHQGYTPNIHGNPKFLVWHRYFLWVFEDVLRTECGLDVPIPWFDEQKYAGRFSQSSVFSANYFGAIALGGRCVTNGKFANLVLNIGPGTAIGEHCLSRNGDGAKTANTGKAFVDACNSRTSYADMGACSEGGAHAWGHNGIGSVMQDPYASPGDPVFWLHHAFIDRNFRIWQNKDSNRVNVIDGRDVSGNLLTFNTDISVNGIRPNVKIGDVMNTLNTKLGCYRYDY
ncbi:hypothetical protein B0H66DRAFT_570051 [Apodospora peruviana]|uniref:Tyrosinase copper-binding domain-containing protein n=1 Tax=Apodospora peruviana TaxID=516989 RepID=A0AAE0LY72_9PEZI|nr:hypothetical protein B0H66DRAFT_570051 [Apodospora peruviana]